MALYVEEHYLKGVKPGAPFLLVTRFFENVRTRYYLGRLADSGRIVNTDAGGITIRTRAFETWPDLSCLTDVSLTGPEIRISASDMLKTPLKERFSWIRSPRLSESGLEAFSFAVGIDEVTKLADVEAHYARDFSKHYIRSAKRLGIALANTHLELLDIWKLEVLSSLLTKHENFNRREPGIPMNRPARLKELKELLVLAGDLGIASESGADVRIDGITYSPAVLFQDLRRLYENRKE